MLLISMEGSQYINGIVATVNSEIITYRDTEIYSGLKMLKGNLIEPEQALNNLIEEELVYYEAHRLGLAIDADMIEECINNYSETIAIRSNQLLQKSGVGNAELNERCLREKTMEDLINQKFLKPLFAGIRKDDKKILKGEKQDAIANYKIWINEILSKSNIEKYPENLNPW